MSAEPVESAAPPIPEWIGYRVKGLYWDFSSGVWRDQWDRYVVPGRDHHEHSGRCGCGVGVTRVTTGTKSTSDESTLIDFLQRHTVKGLALDPGLLAEAAALPLPGEQPTDDPRTDADLRKAWKDLSSRAKRLGGGDEAADMGNFLHDITEEIDCGRLTVAGVDAHVRQEAARGVITVDQVERYDWTELARAWVELRDANFEVYPELTEVTLRNWDFDWCGTADRIVIDKTDGAWKVLDLKTGSITWDAGKFASQEASYAVGDVQLIRFPTGGSPFYDDLPEGISQTEGLIVNIPINNPEAAGIYKVSLTRAADETLPLCAAVTEERRRSKQTPLDLVVSLRQVRDQQLPQPVMAAAAPQGRKCGYCRQTGHIRSKCPNPGARVTHGYVNASGQPYGTKAPDGRSQWQREIDEVVDPTPQAFAEIKARAGEAWDYELVNRARARLGLPPKLVSA